MNISNIAAIASTFAATAAWCNVYVQNKNTKRNRSIDLLLKKESEFDSERMQKARSNAAKALLEGIDSSKDIDHVLDFMESVASLVIKGDLEDDDTWNYFYYWFSHYYYAASEIIKKIRSEDSSEWCDLHKLHARMEKIQRKNGNPVPNNLPSKLRKFLQKEVELIEQTT